MEAIIVYWSQTGNTENMANGIADGMRAAKIHTKLHRVEEVSAQNVSKYEKIALGCPAMGNESLEKLEFEPFFDKLERMLKGKKVALFGSFGWGEREWMQNWEKRIQDFGGILYMNKGLAINENSDSAYEDSFLFGKAFAESD